MREIVEIQRMAYGKGAVAKLSSGKTVFVYGAIPKETCEIEITSDHKRYAEAKIVSREVKAEKIPGADWADLDYDAQLKWKKNCVRDAFVRNAKFDSLQIDKLLQDTIASQKKWNYRNKIELPYQGGQLGMMQEGSNKFIQISEFNLAHKKIAKSPKALHGALKFSLHGDDCGIFRVGIRHSERTGDIQVALWTTPTWFPRHEVAKIVSDATGATSIVRIIAESGKARKIKQIEVLSGSQTWEEILTETKFSVSAPSFFQVNTEQAELLQTLVIRSLKNIKTNRVADLYCGVGTFTLPLSKAGFNVSGVELAGSSTKDLAKNLKRNEIEAKVICDDVKRALPSLDAFEACVVDPPKAGLDATVVKQLIERSPKQITYVSCDPMTLSRDVRNFVDAGYKIKEITPVDMFPQTHHVETVVVIEH